MHIKLLNILTILWFATTQIGQAQNIFKPEISIVNTNKTSLPGVQSFAIGVKNDEWLVIGGRKDGLHRRQPFAAFQKEGNNTEIYVINPETSQVWTSDLNSLPTELQEQLQSTNIEFCQEGDFLSLMGGYGYSATKDEHITYNGLVIIDIPMAIQAIKTKSSLVNAVKYGFDDRVSVTGGQLGKLNDIYYLVGGQKFEGSYNPMGPDHGPGFFQQYTNSIRTFKISETGGKLQLVDFKEQIDSLELHRRDFNMLKQIFPNGTEGFTAFSGVFQYKADIPWLNTVDIVNYKYEPIPAFEQRLNQYHGAKLALYEPTNAKMYNFFFGGISRFYADAKGDIIDDLDVPFVKTISVISRDKNGKLEEEIVGKMPDFLGASAEFVPSANFQKYMNSDMLKFDADIKDSLFLGYIFGGIKSSADKIFWTNEGTQSEASNQIYKVYLRSNVTSSVKASFTSYDYFKPVVYPNPAFDYYIIEFYVPEASVINVNLNGLNGKQYYSESGKFSQGYQKMRVPIDSLPDGNYFISLDNGKYSHTMKLIK